MFERDCGKGVRWAATLLLCLSGLGAARPGGAVAAEYDLRVHGHAAVGDLPPKTPHGDRDTVGVVGEGTGETEYLAADEIAGVVASAVEKGPNGEVALRVIPVPGRGGLQTVRDVLSRPNLDFGIAPVPVLEAAAATDGMANLRRRLAYVAPLYFEEVHLLAAPDVHEVEDLDGKEVSLGAEGSSTQIIAQAVLTALGVKVKVSNLAEQAAVDAMRDGRLSAAFVVSGKPVASVGRLWGRTVRLLSLPADRMPEGFAPAVLEHEDYPDLIPLGMRVRTYAVRSVLFAYDWPMRSARGKVGRTFLSVLLYRLTDLQAGGHHPKWRDVNVAGFVPGWRRLPAMQAWLDEAGPLKDGAPSQEQFEAYLRRTDTHVSGEDREALYRDYLRWHSSPMARNGK